MRAREGTPPGDAGAESDRGVLEALRAGDEAAFLSLVEHHHGAMLRAAGRLEESSLRPEARATLLQAFRGWRRRG